MLPSVSRVKMTTYSLFIGYCFINKAMFQTRWLLDELSGEMVQISVPPRIQAILTLIPCGIPWE